jgi:hypothetical protein
MAFIQQSNLYQSLFQLELENNNENNDKISNEISEAIEKDLKESFGMNIENFNYFLDNYENMIFTIEDIQIYFGIINKYQLNNYKKKFYYHIVNNYLLNGTISFDEISNNYYFHKFKFLKNIKDEVFSYKKQNRTNIEDINFFRVKRQFSLETCKPGGKPVTIIKSYEIDFIEKIKIEITLPDLSFISQQIIPYNIINNACIEIGNLQILINSDLIFAYNQLHNKTPKIENKINLYFPFFDEPFYLRGYSYNDIKIHVEFNRLEYLFSNLTIENMRELKGFSYIDGYIIIDAIYEGCIMNDNASGFLPNKSYVNKMPLLYSCSHNILSNEFSFVKQYEYKKIKIPKYSTQFITKIKLEKNLDNKLPKYISHVICYFTEENTENIVNKYSKNVEIVKYGDTNNINEHNPFDKKEKCIHYLNLNICDDDEKCYNTTYKSNDLFVSCELDQTHSMEYNKEKDIFMEIILVYNKIIHNDCGMCSIYKSCNEGTTK